MSKRKSLLTFDEAKDAAYLANRQRLYDEAWPEGKYAISTTGHVLIWDRTVTDADGKAVGGWKLKVPIVRIVHAPKKDDKPLNLGIKAFKRERRGTRNAQRMIAAFKQAVWTNQYLKSQGGADGKK